MREVALPEGSLVAGAFAVTHYADAFALTLPPGEPPGLDALVRALASTMPWWVATLLHIRDRAVSLIGLRSSGGVEREAAERATLQPGDRAGLFNIYARTDDEILMGGDDRHLDFRASMLVRPEADGHAAVLSTVVHYNNRLGRFYFFFVRPFHRLIIPSMLRRLRRELDRDSAASPSTPSAHSRDGTDAPVPGTMRRDSIMPCQRALIPGTRRAWPPGDRRWRRRSCWNSYRSSR